MNGAGPTGRRQAISMLASGVVFIVGVMWMLTTSAPYAVQSPGPTIDTLGKYHDIELITIDGTQTYPDTETQLRLTTVVAAGGPGFPVTVSQVMRGWLSNSSTVLPSEYLFDPQITEDQIHDQSQIQMSRSQHDAAIMAMAELGIAVPVVLHVAGTDPNSGAHALIRPGDVVEGITTSAGRLTINTYPDLSVALAQTPPGSTVTLHLLREGEDVDVDVLTGDDSHGGSLLGLFLDPEFDMPFEVTIEIDRVGGPSAGMMLALGVIDRLTPGALAGDNIVAGTGTISLNSRVGEIGGIRQKMQGAKGDGATYFLAPAGNCAMVAGHEPRGLQVIRVETLHDARLAVEAIADGNTADLPACTAG